MPLKYKRSAYTEPGHRTSEPEEYELEDNDEVPSSSLPQRECGPAPYFAISWRAGFISLGALIFFVCVLYQSAMLSLAIRHRDRLYRAAYNVVSRHGDLRDNVLPEAQALMSAADILVEEGVWVPAFVSYIEKTKLISFFFMESYWAMGFSALFVLMASMLGLVLVAKHYRTKSELESQAHLMAAMVAQARSEARSQQPALRIGGLRARPSRK